MARACVLALRLASGLAFCLATGQASSLATGQASSLATGQASSLAFGQADAWAAQEQPPFAPGESAERVSADLEVWAWNIAAGSLSALVPEFTRLYPECRVFVNMTGMNLESRFLLSLSAGVGAPDISQLQLRDAPRYAVTGKLADLTPFVEKYAASFPASFWENCVCNGRVYAIPWDMGPCAVFYKRSLFAQYGLDPEAIVTWDDFIAAGKRLVEQSGGKTKMLCLPTGGLSDYFEILMQQNSAQIFDSEGRVAIYSKQAVEAIEVLKRLLQANIGANMLMFGHAFLASFKSNTVATYPHAAWLGGTIRDEAPATSGDWGVFRLPAIHPGGLRTSNLGGSVLVIPDQGSQKEAAWNYVEYCLCTPAAQIEQYRRFNLFPALLSTHSDPFFDEPDPFFGDQKVRRLFAQDIGEIQALNRTTDWMESVRYVNQALSAWAAADRGPAGELAPVDDLLARLEEKLARRLGREISPLSLSQRAGEAP